MPTNMSKKELILSLRREVRKLNRIIDHRIIMGQSYRDESRRHMILTSQLNRLFPPRKSWFGRAASLVSLFML